ncbi:MAG: hypothetical protein AVDCRST_MAG30-1854, partial [uncultured Solirubrobacteraceae bacterium]
AHPPQRPSPRSRLRPARRRSGRGRAGRRAAHPALRLARRLLRGRLPADQRRRGRRAGPCHEERIREPAAQDRARPRLPLSARQLRLRWGDDGVDPRAQDGLPGPGGGRSPVHRPHAGRCGDPLPAAQPGQGGPHHRLDRRQRRDGVRRGARSRGVRQRRHQADRAQRRRARAPAARRRRARRPHRRADVSGRHPRPVHDRAGARSGARPPVRRRLPGAHQPGAQEGLRHGARPLRRRHPGHRRVRALRADDDARPLRDDPGGGGARLRAELLLLRPRHPPADAGLPADGRPDRQVPAAAAAGTL